MKRGLLILWLALAWNPAILAETRIVTETLELEFGSDGTLDSATACFPSRSSPAASCGSFGTRGVIGHDVGNGNWTQISKHSDTHFELRFEHASGASLSWKIPLNGYLLELKTEAAGPLRIRSGAAFRPRAAAGFGAWLEQTRYLGIADGRVTQVGLDEEEFTRLKAQQWSGYRNRFWVLLAGNGQQLEAQIKSGEDTMDAAMILAAGEGAAAAFSTDTWSVYLGPVEPGTLRSANPELSGILYAGLWFWLRWICFALYYIFSWIATVIPSWGLAVMALSLTVNILMRPLSRIADRFQQQVHETEVRLAPELQRIKQEFKGEKQATKILALYKAERVHPLYSLKSMIGVAVVIPVFIGAFDMLAENIHLLNASFLWIADLSRPDALTSLPFSLPFFGRDLNLLPFLMTGLSTVATVLHNPPALNAQLRKKQVRNMFLLAAGFFALFYTFPAGMVLYWTTSNLIAVIKSIWGRLKNSNKPAIKSEA
ncbi:MAG: membrane protein insertase YidC [Xanthomonadales bacterium]